MKKIKILLLLLTAIVATFYSCSDNNPVENEVVATKSISLRTTLNEIKKANNIPGKTNQTTLDQAFCFNFVYPITLSYNNGTAVTVATYDGLIEILTDETNNLYIDGIVFPFQVQEENTITTINNEAEFYALIDACTTFETVNDLVVNPNCYQIVYPISVIGPNGQTVTVTSDTQLNSMISPAAGTYQLDIVFPISLTLNNQTVVANDLYELFDYFDDCTGNACNCPTDINPVCVQTANGIVQFDNACLAECAGYTANDFVDCNSNNPCNCPTDFLPVCVQTATGIVQYDNACRAICDGFSQADFVNCSTATQTFGQLLGNCFTISYPVQIQNQGALVTVNNDGECLQYWFPVQNSMPAFSYPITVTFGNQVFTFANQAAFQTQIDLHCN
ncbi:hypothetical protein [Flavobacterium sp. XGLA_31]|uniref:hypothetical protein n=1 Tax=Flavobacterium sp. XGLA_31 TaxID=3447666 RepID=UPI003F2DB841